MEIISVAVIATIDATGIDCAKSISVFPFDAWFSYTEGGTSFEGCHLPAILEFQKDSA